jgi:RNA polymerase sigma factor (sigma-70 family)
VKNVVLQQIIKGCIANDRRSQKALYDKFYGYALSIALPYCNIDAEAREIVNDAMMKAFTGIGKYDSSFPFTSWLRTIVIRTAINHYHKHLNEIVLMDLMEGADISTEDDYFSNLAAENIVALLQKLPPAYRLTINLFALEGYSHPEIAEMLGISIGASKSNLSKARAKLKQIMTDHQLKKYG